MVFALCPFVFILAINKAQLCFPMKLKMYFLAKPQTFDAQNNE
jgi:hypothetical protein